MNTITLSVNTSGLIHSLKAMFSDRFKVISELIQNARRAQSGIVELTLEGSDLNYEDILHIIEDAGGTVHSIDEAVAGHVLVEDVPTMQD